ncbi:MAG: hypothetical protein L0220_33925 [Acidobacteria bacterium]|nr:hypothetical protein [Acidobacteriota bacterium]
MRTEEEKIEYWTESTLLKERGWSKGRIAKLLYVFRKVAERPTRQHLLHVADQSNISSKNRQEAFSEMLLNRSARKAPFSHKLLNSQAPKAHLGNR